MPQKLIELGIVSILLLGIILFRGPRIARLGNLAAAFAMLCGVVLILARHSLSPIPLLLVFAAAGTAAGWYLAVRVKMIRIPAMVAFQNGMGGMASFLVSFVELTRFSSVPSPLAIQVAALLGMVTGATTFTGSMVAAGRLANLLNQQPLMLRRHNMVLSALGVFALALMLGALCTGNAAALRLIAVALVAVAAGLGVVFAIRVGGADMPVLISFLNAGTGLAAAFCGVGIGSWLLIACGAMVGVSGMILTQVMCRAMNRSLLNVFAGLRLLSTTTETAPVHETEPAETTEVCPERQPTAQARTQSEVSDPFAKAVEAARSAKSVIIVPGYGMALADAQEATVKLAERLASTGKSVLFAIHPVAGRMPGHMHVLLAEAEVDYGMIRELKDVNPQFAQTDLALIVGACDVVNPAAIESKGTPISGMPILRAHEARTVVVCNLDDRPGYSGVENLLYRQPHAILLLGDARETLDRLLLDLA
ncbi:MAG: NAD(P)(+) transhydrogenase (Re/Si-specific) subunit beta [Planctomycetes bacterium]|nr:NAD(P)(+) transhydrogenase (Re/Si-specific) subunit beta [Planctomycetota bacterium]